MIRFDDYRLDIDGCKLQRQGQHINLAPAEIELLILLASGRGSVVSHEQIADTLWRLDRSQKIYPAIRSQIVRLRQKLGDESKPHRYVEAMGGRGYRFIGHIVDGRRVNWWRLATSGFLIAQLFPLWTSSYGIAIVLFAGGTVLLAIEQWHSPGSRWLRARDALFGIAAMAYIPERLFIRTLSRIRRSRRRSAANASTSRILMNHSSSRRNR